MPGVFMCRRPAPSVRETTPIEEILNHLRRHGHITETELVAMLGSPRAYRSFCLNFEAHAAAWPFKVRIDIVDGHKRYVREETL